MLENLEEIAKTIFEINNLGVINSIEKINIGFNNSIYCVNDEYIIKICKKEEKEKGIKQEIDFYQYSVHNFHPKLIASDLTKKEVPFIYLVEESIEGINLYDVWTKLSNSQKKEILIQLLGIMKLLHKRRINNKEGLFKIMKSYSNYLEKAKTSSLFSQSQVEYLQELELVIPQYFSKADFSYIHGDIHFNNLILDNGGKLKIIDFENYAGFPKDKEFDSISRMARQPKSYRQNGNNNLLISENCSEILPFFKENYKEVCNVPSFNERLLIYDCLNSLKWIFKYPEHEVYHNILFDKSKRLIK